MSKFKNVDKSFTEVFSLLMHENASLSQETLKTIYKHISNAIDLILRGIQGLMELFSMTKQEVANSDELWSFFSLITNLVESLNWFRSNISYTLRQRNILDY
jgi:hypothetical protein